VVAKVVAMHVSFFLFLIVEIVTNNNGISPLFPLFFILFLAVQALRIWCIRSLGTFWNTKILILPDAQVVRKGPYEYMRHPNYAVVCLEILLEEITKQLDNCLLTNEEFQNPWERLQDPFNWEWQ